MSDTSPGAERRPRPRGNGLRWPFSGPPSRSTACSSAGSAGRSGTSSWLGARTLLSGAIVAYAVAFAALSMLRHRAFETGRFDLGNMVQAVWATAHGRPLQVTDVHGEQFTRLGAHVDPILVLLAPLWWVWPSPDMLLGAQALAVALGAAPVFLLARKHLGSERAGVGFAVAYLLLPATQWLTLNEFHPVALACPLLLAAFWFLDEDRLLAFGAFALLAAASKEEIALVVAGFGAWYAVAHRRWLAGAAVAVAGVAWTALAVAVVIPHFNDGASSSFYSRYDEVGGSPGGILRTALHDPGTLLSTAFDHGGSHYLLHLLAPLAGLALLAPLAAAAALPELAVNLLSSTGAQRSVHFHYTAGAIPPLVVASVLGAARLARRWPRIPVAGLVVAAALAANYRLGAIPIWSAFPGGEDYQSRAWRVTEHDRVAARALRLIPRDAAVAATNSLGAHLSERRRILSFPFLADAKWVAADETSPGYPDRLQPLPTAIRLVRLRRDPRWRLVFEEDGILVFRRARPASAGTP